jgi:hypothetical protein
MNSASIQKIVSFPLRVLIVLFIYAKWSINRWGGLRSSFDIRLSEGKLDSDHVELPASLRRRFKRVVFKRGLVYDNCRQSEEATEIVDAMLAHLEKHYDPANRKIKPIETADFSEMSDPERFYEKYVKSPRPVIIKNFPLDKEKWSLEYFGKVFKDYPVLVTNLTTQQHEEQTLGYYLNSDENTYIHTNESLWYGDPTLETSLPLNQFEAILKRNLATAHLFVGKRKEALTPFHCANNYNVFFQLKGRKRWTFVNPEYTYMMYPMVSKFRAYYASAVPCLEGCDNDRFKLFKYCPVYQADLEEGDLLINPPLWWHSVQALTDATLSVASRWGSMGQATMFGTSKLTGCVDTNHLFTSISAMNFFNPVMTLIESAKLLHINHGKIDLSPKVKGNTTLYETGSHDDMPLKGMRGELNASWRHRAWMEKHPNGAPVIMSIRPEPEVAAATAAPQPESVA